MRDFLARRGLVLALVLAPFLIFAAVALWRGQAGEAVFAGLPDGRDIGRIELARGTEQVVLHRRLDTGEWVLLSAEDAPGDRARIEATLDALRALRGVPTPPGTPMPQREGVELRLSNRKGEPVGHARFWTGQALVLPVGPKLEREPLPDGRRLEVEQLPALPLWPSAWSNLKPPEIAAGEIVSAQRIAAAGTVPLSPAQVAALGRMLSGLSPKDFVPARQVNWAGADYVQALTRGGATIEVQAVSDGDGRTHVRLTSDRDAAVRAARAFAFRVEGGLP